MTFTELYDHYFPKVYNYARWHVKLPAEADDIAGRVFEAALKAFPAYDPAKGPAQAWLFAIARNAVADWARTRARRAETGLDDIPEPESAEPRPEAALERRQEAELIQGAVAGLDERSRDIVALKFSSGMTNREISAMTGLGESNVAVIIYRAVKKLQSKLDANGI